MLLFCSAMSVLVRATMNTAANAPKNFVQSALSTLLQCNKTKDFFATAVATPLRAASGVTTISPASNNVLPADINCAIEPGPQDFTQQDRVGFHVSATAAQHDGTLLQRLTGPDVIQPVVRALSWGMKLSALFPYVGYSSSCIYLVLVLLSILTLC